MNKSVVFQCPSCGMEYEGSAEDFGAEFACEKCGKTFRLNSDCVQLDSAKRRRPSGFECWLGIYQQYFGFRGRMSRRAFWWAHAFQFLLWFVGCIICAFLDNLEEELILDSSVVLILPIFVCMCAGALPMLAAFSRRLHDTNKSAWWLLLILVPVLHLALLAWLLTHGDKGRNRFGPAPEA